MHKELDEPLRTPVLAALEALVSASAILGYGVVRLGEELISCFPLTPDEIDERRHPTHE